MRAPPPRRRRRHGQPYPHGPRWARRALRRRRRRLLVRVLVDGHLELIVVIIEVRGEEAEQNVLRGFRRSHGVLCRRRRLDVSVALFVGAAGKGSGKATSPCFKSNTI